MSTTAGTHDHATVATAEHRRYGRRLLLPPSPSTKAERHGAGKAAVRRREPHGGGGRRVRLGFGLLLLLTGERCPGHRQNRTSRR
jgi:hypothetical protein